MLQWKPCFLWKWRLSVLGILHLNFQGINTAPTATGVDVVEIGDGQIQVPVSAASAVSLFKATVAGCEIFYEASVELNATGGTTTRILRTVNAVTTINSAGLTITGIPEVLSAASSWSAITTFVPISAIPVISSTPPIFTFTSVDANGQFEIKLGQVLTRVNGSIYTVVLNDGSSTTQTTTEASSKETESGSLPTAFSLPTSSSWGLSTEAISNTSSSPSVTFSGSADQTSALLSALASFPISRPRSTMPPSSVATSQNGPNGLLINSSFVSNAVFNPQNSTTGPRISVTSLATSLKQAFSSSLSSSLESSPTSGAVLDLPGLTLSTKVQGKIASSPTSSEGKILLGSQISNVSLTTTSIAQTSRASSITKGYGDVNFNSTQNGTSPVVGEAYRLPSLSTSNRLVQQTTTGGGIFFAGPSSSALAGLLPLALAQGQSSTITTIPPGMSIQTITTKTCSTAGAMVTTTAAGGTVTQVVPEVCDNGLAFLFFGWANIPQLCDARLGLFGFLLQFICDTKIRLPYGFDLISSPSTNPNTPGTSPPDAPNNSPSNPQDEDETPTTLPRASETSSRTSMMSSAPVVVDTWIDEMYDFLTTSVSLPSTASVVYMTNVPNSVNNATLASYFSSIYTEMMIAAGIAQSNATAAVNSTAYTKTLSMSSSGAKITSESISLIATISSTIFPTVSLTVSTSGSPTISSTAPASPDCIYEM